MNGSGLLTCPKLREITFHGVTPTFTGGWSDYCTAPANYITVYLNESLEVCNHLHQYSTVWSEFMAVSPLPDQTNPNRNVSFTIKGGRVKVGNSSTYILSDANYQVEQFSDFTFQVTKLYGSDYLVKSVKINGEEMGREGTIITKWNEWHTPEISNIAVKDGDIVTVGIHVQCAGAGAWGKIDDAEVNSMGD